MKIDSDTVIPIGWVLSGMVVIIAATVIGAFWVSSVDSRLGRIEEKLGIPPYAHDGAYAHETHK